MKDFSDKNFSGINLNELSMDELKKAESAVLELSAQINWQIRQRKRLQNLYSAMPKNE